MGKWKPLIVGNAAELMQDAFPAFVPLGIDVGTIPALSDAPSEGNVLVIVKAEELGKPVEEVIEALRELPPARALVALPADWKDSQEEFQKLPAVAGGLTGDVTWKTIAQKAQKILASPPGQASKAKSGSDEETAKPPSSSSPANTQQPHRRASRSRQRGKTRPATRIGFYGTRGGAGVSTAALEAAQALAGDGRRVALFDATGRGDLHIMMDQRPVEQPVRQGNVTLFLGRPDEEQVEGFHAVVIDGGREQGKFNADWVEVSKPLSQNRLQRLVGLDTTRDNGGRASPFPSSLNLGGLISVEITD